MDWIDEIFLKLRQRIHNLSLVKAAAVYFFVFAFAAFVSSILIVRISHQYITMWNEEIITLSENQIFLWKFINNYGSYCFLLLFMIMELCLFYKRRLKIPFQMVNRGVEEIRNQNLNFEIAYHSKDEMGEFCHSLEQMRLTLIANNEKVWKTVEEQKQLNAAFAHDLRTPITVLKGYSEFLSKYLPEGKISVTKMTDILHLMTEQLNRLTEFSQTMKQLRSLEEYPLRREDTKLYHLYRKISGLTEALNQAENIHFSVKTQKEELAVETILLDENLVLEVLDNLISNAIRFAEQEVSIFLKIEQTEMGRFLYLYVDDDGCGFQNFELNQVIRPYFTGQPKEGHFGLGLHICSILCMVHKGAFSVANQVFSKGATVCASFLISERKN